MRYIILMILLLASCARPQAQPRPYYSPRPPVVQPPLPTPKFTLTYSCPKTRKVYMTKRETENIQDWMSGLDVQTKITEWELLPFGDSRGPNMLNSPFNQQQEVRWILDYWTQGTLIKEFDDGDDAKIWQIKLIEYGFHVK